MGWLEAYGRGSMDIKVKPGGSGASAPGRSMKIYFCDICNESIPLKDINSNRITIEEGKIFCQKCAPKKARASERVPGPVLAVLVMLILVVGALGTMGWQLISNQATELRALTATVERLDRSLSGASGKPSSGLRGQLEQAGKAIGALRAQVRLLGDDFTLAKNEIRSRHDSLAQREQDHHVEQQKAIQDAIERLMATLQPDIEAIKNEVRTLKASLNSDAMLEIKVLKEKLQLLQDVVTARVASLVAPAGEPAALAPGDAVDAPADAGESLEDKETKAHIEKLASEDPGKRYSAVIALGRYSGDRVVTALEGMLAPDSDPEDYVRVAVIQTLRKLGSATSIPHIIGALRDTDYFVRVAARGALRSITGTKMDFDPDGPPSDREGRVKNWERWWGDNKGKLLKLTE